ncbi:MAG TPA: competence/damage-inducible protein A, partial [Mesotoga sp.]|nr:competence/damage-inducible protein A [Mesotoga sp.]
MNHPKAAILITGDEITMGIVNDTNGGYLAETLTAMGYEVQSIVIVQDNAQFMIREMTGALERADLLVITGGLGSTFDDITLQTVARYAGRSLIYDADYRESLERSFKSRFRRKAPADLERQAYTVEGSTILPNAAGSARGCFLKMGAKEIVVLPGPPMEMKAVFAEAIKHMSRPEAPFMRTVGLVDITEPE